MIFFALCPSLNHSTPLREGSCAKGWARMPLRRPHFVAPASCRLFSLVPVLLFPFARHPINPLAIMETVQPSLIAVQPSFSTIRCKTLNIFIKVCYSLSCILAPNPGRPFPVPRGMSRPCRKESHPIPPVFLLSARFDPPFLLNV